MIVLLPVIVLKKGKKETRNKELKRKGKRSSIGKTILEYTLFGYYQYDTVGIRDSINISRYQYSQLNLHIQLIRNSY